MEPAAGFREDLYQQLSTERSDRYDTVGDGSLAVGDVTVEVGGVAVEPRRSSPGRLWAMATAAFLAVVLAGAATIWLSPGSETASPGLAAPDAPSNSAPLAEPAPETTTADRPGDLVFSRPLPWTLVFDSGVSSIHVLDLNHDEFHTLEVEGARGGDQPYRLTMHDGHLVVGWGEIHAFNTATLESSLLDEATIHVPAAEPSRVWMIDYPGGRIGPDAPQVWQVHVAGGQTTKRQELDVDGFPAHGVPGGVALESDSGVTLWDADTGEAVGRLGSGSGFVSDATVDGMLAWCEGSCREMKITTLGTKAELVVPHPEGEAFHVRAARFSDDGRYLAAPAGADVVIIDTATGDSRIAITFPVAHSSVSWAPDGQIVFAASNSFGEPETSVGYYSVVSGTAEVSSLPSGGAFGFVVLPTHEAGPLLGTDPVAETYDRASGECPLTIPVSLFTPPSPYPPDPVHDGMIWYGTDELWTVLDIDGTIGYRKSVWWSANFPGGAEEGEPEIRVTWERLDDPDHEIIVDEAPGTNAYTAEDGDFMIAGIDPQIAGCWRVTAAYKGSTLSYVYETPQR